MTQDNGRTTDAQDHGGGFDELTHWHDGARQAVETYAREAMAASAMFGRERAFMFALLYAEPTHTTDAANVAQLRGVFAGLRAAGALWDHDTQDGDETTGGA